MSTTAIFAQTDRNEEFTRVSGTVSDSENRAVADASVVLERDDHKYKFDSSVDELGRFGFANVPPGKYEIRTSKAGYGLKKETLSVIQQKDPMVLVIHLLKEDADSTAKKAASTVEFSDEPKFTVAGVTDPTNLGGHGSDTSLRTREALAKEAASLHHEGSGEARAKTDLTEESANLHTRLADAEESAGRPLEAVREYQLAAGIEPSEARLFAWGAELLLHRAFDPAIEVFSTGHKKYPNSARMLLGLGVATYDQGATERGERLLLEACDLHPGDATPYLFLGRVQEAEKIEPQGWAEKFWQFVRLHPENPQAHYFFAVALSKKGDGQTDSETVERELKKAIALDPQFGSSYLQLGISYAARKDASAAIAAFEKAIEISPLPDEAHFRLAEIYRQRGDAERARKEMALYNQTWREKSKEAEAQRHEIRQFVYTLREKDAGAPPKDLKPE